MSIADISPERNAHHSNPFLFYVSKAAISKTRLKIAKVMEERENRKGLSFSFTPHFRHFAKCSGGIETSLNDLVFRGVNVLDDVKRIPNGTFNPIRRGFYDHSTT